MSYKWYNVIPSVAIGNSAKCLGYAHNADDLCVGPDKPYQKMLDFIKTTFGENVTILYHDDVFWKSETKAGQWDLRNVSPDLILAAFNCMWCGGRTHYVLNGDVVPTRISITNFIESSDSVNHGVGWCDKCESYCYGDCSTH